MIVMNLFRLLITLVLCILAVLAEDQANVQISSIFASVTGFSSNYDTVLINDQPEVCKDFLMAEDFSMRNARSPLTLLLWPFNLTILSNMHAEENRRLLIVLSLDNVKSLGMILESFADHYNGSSMIKPIFLILMKPSLYNDIPAVANVVPKDLIDLSSDIYFINLQNASEMVELYSIKNIIQIQFVQLKDQDLMTAILIKATRRQNFFQVPLVGVVQNIDVGANNGGIRVKRTGVDDRIEFLSGFRLTEFQYFSDALNFTIADGIEGKGFPFVSKNGSGMLTGIGTQLELNEADLAPQSIEFMPFRIGKLSYLHATSEENLCAYFKQLPVNSIRNIYFDAFPMDLWAVYLFVWMLLTGSAILIDGMIGRASRSTDASDNADLVSDNILQAIGTFCQQGWYDERTSSSGIKILKITELLTSLIMYSAYCASLVSLFSVPVVPIGSFKDILSYSFELYPDNYSLAAQALIQELQSANATFQTNQSPDFPIRSLDESVDLILGSRSAYLIPEHMYLPELLALNYSTRFICENIMSVTNFREPVKAAMIVKKNSPLKETFNLKILEMFERGIRSRNRANSKREKALTCLTANDMNPVQDPLELMNVSTAFIVIAVGIILSFASLLIERIICVCNCDAQEK